MTSEFLPALSLAVAAVLITGMLCMAALTAWRGWLRLKRLEVQMARQGHAPMDEAPNDDTGALIELAAVKERLRRLEAIANGVEL